MIELTLDNFEELYGAYLKNKKYSRIIVGYSPLSFINEVKSNNISYKRQKLFTRIKDLKWSPEITRRIDEIERRALEL